MKLLFFSDIHGMPAPLEQLLAHAEQLRPDRMILLGDILYHGPRNGVPDCYDPQRVVKLLNACKERIVVVRGNCDAEVDQTLLEFPIMADFSEVLTEKHRFFLTHGHLWNENNLPPASSQMILVHGHTHIPELKEIAGGVTIFNPGSISLPKGGRPGTFGFWDGDSLSVRTLDGGKCYIP